MTVAAHLDDLRADLPGCSLVVFGDFFSQITLCVSSQDKHPQERLDALCVSAGSLLDGPVAQVVTAAMGLPDNSAFSQAILLSPSSMQIFLRSPAEESDMLACVLSLDADAETATNRARAALQLIAQV
ncbi:MAG: hypothetical protein L3J36_11545 [Rhodobacteraceae bacterium]|nr:hypothetical protein [Paracoccaceae bacterium]